MTVEDVAALSKRARSTLYNRASQGLEPQPLRHGVKGQTLLYRRADVLRWLGLDENGGRR